MVVVPCVNQQPCIVAMDPHAFHLEELLFPFMEDAIAYDLPRHPGVSIYGRKYPRVASDFRNASAMCLLTASYDVASLHTFYGDAFILLRNQDLIAEGSVAALLVNTIVAAQPPRYTFGTPFSLCEIYASSSSEEAVDDIQRLALGRCETRSGDH